MASTPLLFTPIALGGLTARNRVVVSPMCQYSSEDGGPTDYHLVHLGQFAMGGAGIVFCEETSVEERGRKSYHCAGIYRDAHVPGYRRINDFLRSHGAIPAIQIGHGGRKGSGCAAVGRIPPAHGGGRAGTAMRRGRRYRRAPSPRASRRPRRTRSIGARSRR